MASVASFSTEDFIGFWIFFSVSVFFSTSLRLLVSVLCSLSLFPCLSLPLPLSLSGSLPPPSLSRLPAFCLSLVDFTFFVFSRLISHSLSLSLSVSLSLSPSLVYCFSLSLAVCLVLRLFAFCCRYQRPSTFLCYWLARFLSDCLSLSLSHSLCLSNSQIPFCCVSLSLLSVFLALFFFSPDFFGSSLCLCPCVCFRICVFSFSVRDFFSSFLSLSLSLATVSCCPSPGLPVSLVGSQSCRNYCNQLIAT